MLDDGVLDRMSPARLGNVLAAKVGGAVHLDELTAHLDLSAFVLFSSAAATFGAGGQGNYAAANAFLDALADNRRGRGLAATSLAWGAWAGGGMAQSDATVARRVAGGPSSALDPDVALQVLGQALEDGEAGLTVSAIDWSQIAMGLSDPEQVPFLENCPTSGRSFPPAVPLSGSPGLRVSWRCGWWAVRRRSRRRSSPSWSVRRRRRCCITRLRRRSKPTGPSAMSASTH
ncbi:KR domain-containing protein [Thermocatellispora tengchongensis]|uniref:KR domain-containing protein n=1 Tax=Thermocatellispora tengchongensis TaxID=1073253 RepID=UPI00363E6B24